MLSNTWLWRRDTRVLELNAGLFTGRMRSDISDGRALYSQSELNNLALFSNELDLNGRLRLAETDGISEIPMEDLMYSYGRFHSTIISWTMKGLVTFCPALEEICLYDYEPNFVEGNLSIGKDVSGRKLPDRAL